MVKATKLWLSKVVGVVLPDDEAQYKTNTAGTIMDLEVNLYFHTFVKNILFGTTTSTKEALTDLTAQFGV